MVAASSGFEQVGVSDDLTIHTLNDLPVTENGYLYIYTSNATKPIEVFFDNLQVTHIRGPLLEETHYYPFGLTMNGISSKALNFGNPENKKKKFQGQEYNDDLSVDMYEFKYRMDDPQIGRFWQVDPLTEKYPYNSTYAFSENKLTTHVELEGLESILFGSSSTVSTVALESNNIAPKPLIETVSKVSGETGKNGGTPKFPIEAIKHLARGRATEAEQIAKNGLLKNNKPVEVLDPKTGQSETTIPDAFKNGGKSTVEIKDVKNQSLTKQLRLQEKFSNDNGLKPELIINKGAQLSAPLRNSSFDISTYSTIPTDNTGHKDILVPLSPEQQKTSSKKNVSVADTCSICS